MSKKLLFNNDVFDDSKYNHFVFDVKTQREGPVHYDGVIKLFAHTDEFGNGEVSYTDWGDGTVNSAISHQYSTPGLYTVKTMLRVSPTYADESNLVTRLQLVDCLQLSSKIVNASYFFYGCANLESFSNIHEWNTKHITNMSYMFGICTKLKSLNLSNFNTSNVTNMYGMFERCEALTSLDLSSFNTSNTLSLGHMFRTCISLQSVNLSSFNTSSNRDMSYMFDGCESIVSLDLSSFDTSNVRGMSYMFQNCRKLRYLDISNWNTDAMVYTNSLDYVFTNCNSLSISNVKMTNCNSSTKSTIRELINYK